MCGAWLWDGGKSSVWPIGLRGPISMACSRTVLMELQSLTPPVRPFPISIVPAELGLTEMIVAVMKRRITFGCWERVGNQVGNYICMTFILPRNLNENLSFHFWKTTLSEANKLSREGNCMAPVVSTFLRWVIFVVVYENPSVSARVGFYFRASGDTCFLIVR